MPSSSRTFVPFSAMDRQWDARFNVPTDEDLNILLDNVKALDEQNKFTYVLVGGVEIGDRPFNGDYLIRHVHCALVYPNRVSKATVLKQLGVKTGNGYYLCPRNRSLPVQGWIDHHKKTKTKVNETLCLYESGSPPGDTAGVGLPTQKRSAEEKKRKLNDIILEMKELIDSGNDKEAFAKFPRNYLTYGEKIKAMIQQKRNFFKSNGDPHIWLTGTPGSGKSAILQCVYPNYYNKNLYNRFFDLYYPETHTHMLLQDLDHEVVEKLGVQFLKTICDEAGFPIDQKYKTPQMARTTVLVSSNFSIGDVLPEDMKGRNENLAALRRRFFEVHVRDFLRLIGVKLLSNYEIKGLKLAGNNDPRRLFIEWDYLRDCPTGEPLKTAEEMQTIIKEAYYGRKVQASPPKTDKEEKAQ